MRLVELMTSIASKLLISDDLEIIESISRKLFLLNEKRKLIDQILEEAKDQALNQPILNSF